LKKGAAHHHRGEGEKAMKVGNVQKALDEFGKALKVYPEDVFTLYKRAGLHIVAGSVRKALDDFQSCLKYDPEFFPCKYQQMRYNVVTGDYEQALADMIQAEGHQAAIRKRVNEGKLAGSEESRTTISLLGKITAEKDKAMQGKRLLRQVTHDHSHGESKLAMLSDIIAISPWFSRVLRERALLALQLQKFDLVEEYTRPLLQLSGADMNALLLRGQAMFYGENFAAAKNVFSFGLRSDPEHALTKKWFRHMSAIIKAEKALDDAGKNAVKASEAAEKLEKLLKETPPLGGDGDFSLRDTSLVHPLLEGSTLPVKLCVILSEALDNSMGNLQLRTSAKAACSKAVRLDPEHAAAQKGMAIVAESEENWEEAFRIWQKAGNLNGQDHSLRQRAQRAQKRAAMAARKDYYKILGLTSSASEKEIKKAYRRLALEWHPDHKPASEKEEAEKKFQEIAEAYDVLSDGEKRQMYDNGDDPNAQGQGGGGGGGGFPGGGFPGGFRFNNQNFGGGGGQQQFHFNFGGF